MMTQDYKQEFMLDGACYLNCAYMGPVPQRTILAGVRPLVEKPRLTNHNRTFLFPPQRNPRAIRTYRWRYSPRLDCLCSPAVSYGLATIAKNIGNSPGGC